MKKTGFMCAGLATAAVLAATGGFSAERLAVGSLGEPAHEDSETSFTVALPPVSAKNWRLSMELSGTASNRFECAFGRDINTNSVLDAEEVMAVVAWEQGVWLIMGDGLTERHEAAASSAATNTLTLDIRIGGGDEGTKRVSFREGGAPLAFAGLEEPPPWLDPRGWHTARLTARGPGGRGEGMSCSVFDEGSIIVLR